MSVYIIAQLTYSDRAAYARYQARFTDGDAILPGQETAMRPASRHMHERFEVRLDRLRAFGSSGSSPS